MCRKIVIIDYGSGNVFSMYNALNHISKNKIIVSNSLDVIRDAFRIIIPGVGAFGEVKLKLNTVPEMIDMISQRKSDGVPILGVCVGMQIMADVGHEFGINAGLAWIPGEVKKIVVNPPFKIPHVGWAPTFHNVHAIFNGMPQNSDFYYLHSFSMHVNKPENVIATVVYGKPLVAAVAKDNVIGTQFHPEKSGVNGLKLLANFCKGI
jgi:glutamine amidotransferase